jgi:hypothetical protein
MNGADPTLEPSSLVLVCEHRSRAGHGRLALEVIYLPGRSWLEIVYGGVGVALVLLSLRPSASHHPQEPRR